LEELTKRNCFAGNPPSLKEVYQHFVGLRARNIKNRLKALSHQIRKKYGRPLNKAFQSDTWLGNAYSSYIRPGGSSEMPLISHLILLHHLGIPVSEALKYGTEGLFKCPNTFCECYDKFSIGFPVQGGTTGRFYLLACKHCQMLFNTYKTAPAGTKPRIIRLLRRGEAFDNGVRLMVKQKATVKSISIRTGLSDPTIENIIAELLGQPSKHHTSQYIHERTIQRHKTRILEWKRRNPKGTRLQLGRKPGINLQLLRLFDREWFEQNAPPRSSNRRAYRSQVGESILQELERTGLKGLSINELSIRLSRKPNVIAVWFSTQGKTIPGLRKIGTSRYALEERA
jgi:hypothetical protein